MAPSQRSQPAWWLAPVLGVVLVVTVYRATYESEEGLYAGSEPALAGMLVAAPFCALVLIQVGCVLAMTWSRSERSRTAWASFAALVTGIGVVAAYVVLTG